MKNNFVLLLWCLALGMAASSTMAGERTLPRAIVTDFVNTSKDRHAVTERIATDTVALELTKRDIYNVIARQEVERVARKMGREVPYSEDDLIAIAKELDAALLVTGEVRQVEFRTRDKKPEVEVGLIVRVKNVALGEMVNGAAERGLALDTAERKKPEGLMLIDAAMSAANKAVTRIADYRPIEGTVLNSQGHDIVVLNRGQGHGVRKKQEFLIFRDGVRVGRALAHKVYSSYTELILMESSGGVQGQDSALSIFPEPMFGK